MFRQLYSAVTIGHLIRTVPCAKSKVSATAYMGDSFGATFVRVILWLDLVLGAGRGGQIARLGLRTGGLVGQMGWVPG